MENRSRTSAGASLLIASVLAVAGLIGCGGGNSDAPAKADAVVVTYYYLPL